MSIVNLSYDRDISEAFEKITVTPKSIHDDVNNSHSHIEEKIFQAIDHLKEVSHKRPDIDSIFEFINKLTASDMTKEPLEEIITGLVNKNLIISRKWDGCDSFRRNTAIVNSTIINTQYQDTVDPNIVKSKIETYIERNVNTPGNISQKSSPELLKHSYHPILILFLVPVSQMTILH